MENTAGNYVSINVETPIIIKSLEPLFGGSSVVDPKHQHATLIYSEGTKVQEGKIKKLLSKFNGEIEVYIDCVGAFDALPKDGERDEKLCTIVVKLKSQILNEIHEKLKSIGLKHSYPEFNPHISLLYNIPIDSKKKALDTIESWLKENMSTVTLRGFNVNPIIKNWADDKGIK